MIKLNFKKNMLIIENLKNTVQQIKELKLNAAIQQHFELSATIRDHEKKLLDNIINLTSDNERIIKYAEAHLKFTK